MRQRVSETLHYLNLSPEEFPLDWLLKEGMQLNEDKIVQRIESDGILNGRPISPHLLASRVFQAIQTKTIISRVDEFKTKLEACPAGQTHFAQYEKIGIEIIKYLFLPHLSFVKHQNPTADKVHRHDAIFRNNRSHRFWMRAVEKFNADFVIVDFKNYTNPLEPNDAEEPTKYAAGILGNFILVVSRKGGDKDVGDMQLRLVRQHYNPVCLLVVSDMQLLTMVSMKDDGQDAEDFLEKLYDDLLIKV